MVKKLAKVLVENLEGVCRLPQELVEVKLDRFGVEGLLTLVSGEERDIGDVSDLESEEGDSDGDEAEDEDEGGDAHGE